MIPGDRDNDGALRHPYYVALLREYLKGHSPYVAADFKKWVKQLGVIRGADERIEPSGKRTWTHRIDRAAQRVNKGVWSKGS